MTLQEVALKLDKHLVVRFTPRIADDISNGALKDNPKPWSCQKVDYSSDVGYGTTPDEAATDLVGMVIASAKRCATREYESHRSSEDYLTKLLETFPR